MGLRDELTVARNAKCHAGELLNSLPDDIRAELQELLDDPTVTSSALGRLAQKKEWNCRESSFQRHRKGECLCR